MAEQGAGTGFALVRINVRNVIFNSQSKDNKRPSVAVLSLHRTHESAVIAMDKHLGSYGENFRIEKRPTECYVIDQTKIASMFTYSRMNEHVWTYSIIRVGKPEDE
jgi:hypothetical protein